MTAFGQTQRRLQLGERPAFFERAACRGATELFFSDDVGDVKRACAICAGCPVRVECLDFALVTYTNATDYGVMGGASARGRRRLRNPGGRKKHGTRAAYERGCSCEECAAAARRRQTPRDVGTCVCAECGDSFTTPGGLHVHQARLHKAACA